VAALGKWVSAGAPVLLPGWASEERLLGADNADELLVMLELLVCGFMLSSDFGVVLGTPPPLDGKECGSARKERG